MLIHPYLYFKFTYFGKKIYIYNNQQKDDMKTIFNCTE